MNKAIAKDTSYNNTNLLIISDRDQFPFCIRWIEELQGICIGGCIDGSKWDCKDTVAHSHISLDDIFFGWICSPYKYMLTNRWLLLHEAAHIVSLTKHHRDKWRETLLMMGGSLETKPLSRNVQLKSYAKKVRSKQCQN